MSLSKTFVFFFLFGFVQAVELRPQLESLLPIQIEQLYRELTKNELLAINEALTFEHADFFAQTRRLDVVDRQLAKKFFNAFSDLNKKFRLFSKSLRFFYFWRVLHNINELLSFDVTESNLNKFVSDVAIEWELLSVADQKQFILLYPEIGTRIKSSEFQSFANNGRNLWSVDRFIIPSH